MKDFLGNDVIQGDYFAYPMTIGRSANMCIFQFDTVTKGGSVRAREIKKAYAANKPSFKIWVRVDRFDGMTDYIRSYHRDMNDEERMKAIEDFNKQRTVLKMFSERAILLKDFKEPTGDGT